MPLPPAITLGTFVFQEMEIPEAIAFHRAQRLVVRKLVGGVRQIDAMGVDPRPISWSGVFFPTTDGQSPLQRCQQVQAISDAGLPVSLTWDALSYTVLVSEFEPDFRFARIPYRISVEVLTDNTAPLQVTSSPSTDDAVGDDMTAVSGIVTVGLDADLFDLLTTLLSLLAAASTLLASLLGQPMVYGGPATLSVATPSQIAAILAQLEALMARAAALQATDDASIITITSAGGVVSGATSTTNAAAVESLLAAMQGQANLVQVQALLGRVQTNIEQLTQGTRTITVAGGNCYDIAAREYGDPEAAGLIMTANDLTDPNLTGTVTLVIPPYNQTAAAGGVY